MIVRFRKRKLEKCFVEHKQAVREFGDQVAKRYILRIKIIQHTKSLDDLMLLPALRCHPLTGNRKGQYAVNLTGRYRLIFTLEANQVNVIMIEEVSKHYDD